MPSGGVLGIDRSAPPFDQFTSIQRLGTDRSGHASVEHVRHHLFVARDPRIRRQVLIKLTGKPGLIYQQNLANEIATLSTINRELPDSRHFPLIMEQGRLRDGRVYLVSTLFDEFPLATTIGTERVPGRMVTHLRTTIAAAQALTELHRLNIFHVDLNPMNILYGVERGNPVIRIVDFESSYERARHANGTFYNPPTTAGYCAPEVARQAPDQRADLYSLGAVLYTMLAGFQWTWATAVTKAIEADTEVDRQLKPILLTAVDPDPDKRYGSVEAFQDELAAYLESIWSGRAW
jgi:serine/threonine protein kinase